jgi:magnesium-transporting ATPase (P-type)
MSASVPGAETPTGRFEREQRPAQLADEEDFLSGWVAFAGVVLVIAGLFNVMYGLAAILNDDNILQVGGQGVVVWSTTAWGWATLIVGALMACTGFGLFAGQGWARWTAVALLALNALTHFGFVTLFPLWSIFLIALDIALIYQLTARWKTPITT